MKLLSIKIKKSTATKVQNITHKLQGVKTVGYINIMAKNKVQTVNVKGIPQPKVFKSKTGRKLAILAIQAKQKINHKLSKLFNTSFVQVGIFESKILEAKKALKDAKTMMLSTQEYFKLHVDLCRAYLHLRTFKFALPKAIANLLF
jgi:hypothetical protein